MPREKLSRSLSYFGCFLLFPLIVAILVGVLGQSATLGVKTFLLIELGMAVLTPLLTPWSHPAKGTLPGLSPTYRLKATTVYSFLMSFPPLVSLHHYFVVAARMCHHFESNLVAIEEPRVAALPDPDLAAFELFSGPRGNFMYYWYASLYVVVQGYRNLKLIDPRINALLASPNVKALRRCWNAVFHYQPDYFSAKLPIQSPDFIGWVRELMDAFRAYFGPPFASDAS